MAKKRFVASYAVNSKNLDIEAEEFSSLYQFFNKINTRDLNKFYQNGYVSTNNIRPAFAGVENKEEADNLLTHGYNAVVETLAHNLEVFTRQNLKKNTLEVVGYTPNVQAALKNIPCNMYNTKKVIKKVSAVTLYYSPVVNSNTSKESILEAGANFLNLVNSLEAKGIKTNIYIIPQASYTYKDFTQKKEYVGNFCCVKIKDFKTPLNILKMAYPLAHVAFFRFHGFKWLETFPRLQQLYQGYGMSAFLNSDAKKAYLEILQKKHLLFKDSYFLSYSECRNSASFLLDHLEEFKIN